MSDAVESQPVMAVKLALGCSEEEAKTVVRNIGGLMAHLPTRAFLAKTLHLSNTTRTPKGTRDDFLINEGKRQAGLLIVACAKGGLNLDTYSEDKQ